MSRRRHHETAGTTGDDDSDAAQMQSLVHPFGVQPSLLVTVAALWRARTSPHGAHMRLTRRAGVLGGRACRVFEALEALLKART